MVVCNCTIGPLVLEIPNDTVMLKAIWRTQSVTVITILMMILYYIYNELPFSKFVEDHSGEVLLVNMLAGILMCMWNLGYIIGCSMTITSHATILYTSSGVYLLVFALIT